MTIVQKVCTPLSKIYEILATTGFMEVILAESEKMVEDKMKKCLYHQGMMGHIIEQCPRFRASGGTKVNYLRYHIIERAHEEEEVRKNICVLQLGNRPRQRPITIWS